MAPNGAVGIQSGLYSSMPHCNAYVHLTIYIDATSRIHTNYPASTILTLP